VSVPAADRLRPALVRYCRWKAKHMGRCGGACTWHYELLTHDDVAAAADLLDAIDALHQPVGYDGLYIFDCADCGQAWPCKTHRLLHPEEAGRG
jgi:hypothetical protein